jgi:hypothetical protein
MASIGICVTSYSITWQLCRREPSRVLTGFELRNHPNEARAGWRGLELDPSSCRLCPTIRKPFDALAEGLGSEKVGDRTAIELFTASVAAWDSGLRLCFACLTA